MPDIRANRVAAASGDLGISILARRDVAVMPALVASLASFALAAGEAVRPDDLSPNGALVAVLAVGFGIACAIWTISMGPARRKAQPDRAPAGLVSFLLGFAVLLGALTVAAVLERGLATVAFAGVVLMAPFVGLAFPRSWSRISIATLLAAAAAVHVARPEASGLEVASALALIGAGWVVGLIARMGHANASRRALRLSRSDVLTRTLNRRGFLEEVEYRLQQGARAQEPVALIILDLDDFKRINDGQGHAEGDGLLTWIGAVIPPALPAEAVFGRLGGDEFAVLLPRTGAAEAARIAATLHRVVVERINVSFGVATSATGLVDVDELLRTADLALYEAKADDARAVRTRVATDREARADHDPDAPRPLVSYARLRTATRPLDSTAPTTFNGTWIFAGYATIAISGAVFVLCTMLWGGDSFYEELIRYGGVPWILANLTLGWAYRHRVHDVMNPLAVPIYGSSILVGIGVGTAALSTGSGIASPIIAGLFLKVFFDASTFRRRHGLQMTAIIVLCWLVVVVLGPADELWAVPFQIVLILGALALGSIARRAYEAATNAQLALARTDALTGLLNRAGFRERVERALRSGDEGEALAVIAFDLDGFKQVNDTVGHLAGDRLLRDVADVTAATIPSALAVARYGGDEFMAALTVPARPELDAVVDELDARLASVTQASVGSALFGPDGVTLDALLEVADHRAYAIKEQRHAGGPAAGRG